MKIRKVRSVLDSFDFLRGGSEKAQIGASLDILEHLAKQQDESREEFCRELQLGINRIVRGLGSARSRTRRGYYATFIGLINKFPELSVQIYCDSIEKEFKEYTSNEENDVYKGIVIAYGAIIDSGAIYSADRELLQKVISEFITTGNKRSYLKLALTTFLADMIKKIDPKDFGILWGKIHEKLPRNRNKLLLEDYYLIMVAQERFPMKFNEKYLNGIIGAPHVLHDSLFNNIASKLLNVPNLSYVKSPMYQEFLRILSSSKKFVKKLWEVIDENLQSPTPLRMILAFKLFGWIVTHVDKHLIKYSLTPNFVLLLETSQEIEEIEMARKISIDEFVKSISSKNSLNSKSIITIFEKLFFYPGSFQFFYGLGTKVFRSLRNSLDEDTVKTIAGMLHDVLTDKSMKIVEIKPSNNETVQRPWKEGQKKTIISVLVDLLSHQSVNSLIDWKISLLRTIIDIGFFSKSLSPKLTIAARNSFYTALDHQFPRVTDLRAYLTGLAVYFDKKLAGSNYCAISFTKEMRKEWSRMMSVVMAIEENKTDSGKLASTVFHVMFLLLGMTLFKHPETSIENLKELQNIYKHLNNDAEEGGDMPHWTDVTIDLILSLLSQSNKLNRHVISKIFVYLCPHLSSDNIHQILKVLNPNTENPVMETVNMDVPAERKDVSDDEENSDGSDKEDNDDDQDEDSGSEEESDIDMSEDDMDDGTDYDKLRAVVSDALGNDAALTDTESIDIDDLDEEEGKKLDERLSEAFHLMKQQQQKKQALEEKEMSDFRLRVLDLLTIWVKTEPDLSVLLDALVTVWMLLENSLKGKENLELSNRLKTLLKEATSLKKFKITDDFEREQLVHLIQKVTSKEDRTNSVYLSLAPEIIMFCTFIVKLSMRDIKHMKKVRNNLLLLYKELLNKCFRINNSTIPVGLFQSVLELPWEGGLELVEDVSSLIYDESVRYFQKCQGLRLLEAFFRNKRLLTPEYVQCNEERLNTLAKKVTKKSLKELKKDFSDKYLHQFLQVKDAIKKSGIVKNDSIDWQSVESDLNLIRKNRANRPTKDTSQKISNKKRKISETKQVENSQEDECHEDVKISQAEENSINSQQPPSPKKKKKNTRELTKKDIKMRRAKHSSKGFNDVFSFSKVEDIDFIYNNKR